MSSNASSSYDRETLITAYLRHTGQKTVDDEWAWNAVEHIVRGHSAEAAWDLVVGLVRRAPDAQLGQVAAGPLEDMINVHGPGLVEWIEGESRRDPRFKEALGRVWLSRGTMPLAVEARIVAASGGRIALLSGEADTAARSGTDT
jgi:hypothetical protein